MLDVVRERHPQFDIRRAGAATRDDKGWAHPDRGRDALQWRYFLGRRGSRRSRHRTLAVTRAPFDGAFPVTQADVEAFMRFAAAWGGFSIW